MKGREKMALLLRSYPAQAVVGLIQSHYEKDNQKFDSCAVEIERFLFDEDRDEVARYIQCLRTGTGFVPMDK